jgi:hypothetical protein
MPLAIEDDEVLELLSDALLRIDVGSIIIVTDGRDDEVPCDAKDRLTFLVPPWGEA